MWKQQQQLKDSVLGSKTPWHSVVLPIVQKQWDSLQRAISSSVAFPRMLMCAWMNFAIRHASISGSAKETHSDSEFH